VATCNIGRGFIATKVVASRSCRRHLFAVNGNVNLELIQTVDYFMLAANECDRAIVLGT
jgi:hypothetical protein